MQRRVTRVLISIQQLGCWEIRCEELAGEGDSWHGYTGMVTLAWYRLVYNGRVTNYAEHKKNWRKYVYKCSTEKLEKLWNSTGIGSTGMNS